MSEEFRRRSLFFWCLIVFGAAEEGTLLFRQWGLGVSTSEEGRFVAAGFVRTLEGCGITAFAYGLKPRLIPPLPAQYRNLFAPLFCSAAISAAGLAWGCPSTVAAKQFAIVPSVCSIGSLLLLGPLAEEVIFRGILYAVVRTEAGVVAGMLLSSLLFTVLHVSSYSVIWLLPVFLGSLTMSLVYERWRSLWLCIGLHSAYNGAALVVAAVFLHAARPSPVG